MLEVHSSGRQSCLKKSILHIMCGASNREFVWKFRETEQWYLGLFHFDTSCSVAWPVAVRYLRRFSPTLEYVKMSSPEAAPAIVHIDDWSSIVARKTEWHSFNWLCQQWRGFLLQASIHRCSHHHITQSACHHLCHHHTTTTTAPVARVPVCVVIAPQASARSPQQGFGCSSRGRRHQFFLFVLNKGGGTCSCQIW